MIKTTSSNIKLTYQGFFQCIICQLHKKNKIENISRSVQVKTFIIKFKILCGWDKQEPTFFLGAVISCAFASAYVAMSLIAELTLSRVSLPFIYLVCKRLGYVLNNREPKISTCSQQGDKNIHRAVRTWDFKDKSSENLKIQCTHEGKEFNSAVVIYHNGGEARPFFSCN